MKVKDLLKQVEFESITGEVGYEKDIQSGYVGDLLSVVMGSANADEVWITIQSHINIVAVASLVNLPCIIISQGFTVDKDTIDKAIEEGICILTTKLSSYQVIGKLIELGL